MAGYETTPYSWQISDSTVQSILSNGILVRVVAETHSASKALLDSLYESFQYVLQKQLDIVNGLRPGLVKISLITTALLSSREGYENHIPQRLEDY
jgi:hypothetical protein